MIIDEITCREELAKMGRIVPSFIVKRIGGTLRRMDEKYRTRPKGGIETTSQDFSRIPLASFYLSVHDPCDVYASPSYFIGPIPRSFRNCTRGGGPQNVLLTLFSRHGELANGKKRATIIVLHRFSAAYSLWGEFSFISPPFRKIYHYLRIIFCVINLSLRKRKSLLLII